MNIKQKTEAAIANYLKSISALATLTIVPAHSADVEVYPICIVNCRNTPGESDLPPDTNEMEAEVVIQLITQTDDTSSQEDPSTTPQVPLSDGRITAVVAAMRDVDALKAFVNLAEGVTQTQDDIRAVQDFHLKRLFNKDNDAAILGRNFVDSLEFTAHVCDFSADSD